MIIDWFPWQYQSFGIPWRYDQFFGGGRNGGKSTCAIAHCVRMAISRPGSRSVYFRQTAASLDGVVDDSVDIVPLFDPRARLRFSDPPAWKFSNGSTLTFAPLADMKLYQRWQGINVSGLAVFDESQQWRDGRLPDRILSNLRNPNDLPVPAIYLANPGDYQWWLYERFVKPCPGDGIPYKIANGRSVVTFRTTWRDNSTTPKNYRETLRASTDSVVLFKSWDDGDWSRIGGAAFSDVLGDENLVRWHPDDYWPERGDWKIYLAYDWGLRAPSVALLIALAKDNSRGADGFGFVRGDRVVIDEYHTALPNNLDLADGTLNEGQAHHIKAMCKRWQCAAVGCGDDAIFGRTLGGEISTNAQEFLNHGVQFEAAGKFKRNETTGKTARVTGWTKLRNRLGSAAPPNKRDTAAMYINASRTPYLWETLRMLVPDETNVEDIKEGQPAHAADALRYGVIWEPPAPATREYFGRNS